MLHSCNRTSSYFISFLS